MDRGNDVASSMSLSLHPSDLLQATSVKAGRQTGDA